ncbi:MAG: 1-deoxy-D-xylulose-5-phosphate reductoisomerase, partial [Deltaproteobacteria bacterium]|nr:1-deoxy-D-xylulose-5-phosphate reductoisomerase [Deltaproteobacteria bacterium]
IKILHIDSEHSARLRCLKGRRKEALSKMLLTASGGLFRNKSKDEFVNIKPKDALNHPTWQMGPKISIDSATLMNKGLEVIEAKFLFEVSENRIEVVVHPQSVIHSMVSYKDGSVIAQLGIPDMKGAIAYAMAYPERLDLKQPIPKFASMDGLTFEPPDLEKFPCLAFAFEACKTGGTLPAVLNAANEVAVQAFLNERIPFVKIPDVIHGTMAKHALVSVPDLSDIIAADRWARVEAEKYIVSSEQ